MLILIYVLLFGLMIDVVVWALVLHYLNVLPDFKTSFAHALDSFSTLGAMPTLPAPWELLGPVIALNGIVLIAFSGSYLFSLVYPSI